MAAFAAYAQRPADPTSYAASVNANIGAAQQAITAATQDAAGKASASVKSAFASSASFVAYDQGDPRWANHQIYTNGDTIGPDGCGPTSAAMVIATLTGLPITPIQTGDYMTQHNGFVAGEGASTAGLEAVCQYYGLKTSTLSSFTDAINVIQGGGLIISGGHGDPPGNPPYVSGGHVVVFRAVSGGNIVVGNPAGNFPNPSAGFTVPIAGMDYMIGVTK